MPTPSIQLLIVPALLTALMCFAARRVNFGSAAAQAFEVGRQLPIAKLEMGLDWGMMFAVAGFVIVVDRHDDDNTIFLNGLFLLTVLSVVLTGATCMWRSGWGAVVVRKLAFRSILGLSLFTTLLGLTAAGF